MEFFRFLQGQAERLVLLLQVTTLQRIVDGCQQFPGIIGFAHKIIRPVDQSVLHRAERCLATDHDNLGVDPVLFEVTQHLMAIDTRHLQIEKHQVVALVAQQLKGLAAALGRFHIMTVRLEQHAQTGQHRGIIIHNQDFRLVWLSLHHCSNFIHINIPPFI